MTFQGGSSYPPPLYTLNRDEETSVNIIELASKVGNIFYQLCMVLILSLKQYFFREKQKLFYFSSQVSLPLTHSLSGKALLRPLRPHPRH